MPQNVPIRDSEKIGGAACLDFINTVDWPSLENERLRTYDDALAWGVSAGLLRRGEATGGSGHNAELKALKGLRILLRDVFTGKARSVSAFNSELRRAAGKVAVSPSGQWSIDGGAKTLRYRLLWDAANLFTSARRTKLKMCANPHCGRLFIDDSRRGNRRWCLMSRCGNRDKVRRYYDRVSGRSAGKRPPRRLRRRRGQP